VPGLPIIVPSHIVFAPGVMSRQPIPNAVASMPQMFVAVTQQGLACEKAVIGHFGASGAGGVQVPLTTKPHLLVAASRQHDIGVTMKPGIAWGGMQVAVPQVNVALPLMPAAGAPPLAAGLPAVAGDPEIPVVMPAVGCAGGVVLLLHALPRLPMKTNANDKARNFICDHTPLSRAQPAQATCSEPRPRRAHGKLLVPVRQALLPDTFGWTCDTACCSVHISGRHERTRRAHDVRHGTCRNHSLAC
jgi:hypothetical protein